MKILVTGGRALLATLTRRLLAAGHEVHVVGRSPTPPDEKDFNKITYHQHDLADQGIPPSVLSGTELVFHIAAKAGVGGSYSSYYAANYLATVSLIRVASLAGFPAWFSPVLQVWYFPNSIRDGNESLTLTWNPAFPPTRQPKPLRKSRSRGTLFRNLSSSCPETSFGLGRGRPASTRKSSSDTGMEG